MGRNDSNSSEIKPRLMTHSARHKQTTGNSRCKSRQPLLWILSKLQRCRLDTNLYIIDFVLDKQTNQKSLCRARVFRNIVTKATSGYHPYLLSATDADIKSPSCSLSSTMSLSVIFSLPAVFPNFITLPTLLFNCEPVPHLSCGHSPKQDGSA